MFHKLHGRLGHYVLLLTAAAGLFLPRLGGPSLWDVDEGHNAEAARGMLESGDWVLPKFNGALRVDKPALLYWLQVGAYEGFGVNEFAARLPSALAAALTLLLTYELGRLMFGPVAGLLAGLMLASTFLFCGSAHFANPDALLNACAVLTFWLCWRCFRHEGTRWPALAGASAGLAVLAKGPVGLVLPATVVGVFLLWTRQLRRLGNLGILQAALLFLLVAGPWFALVGSETKGDFLRGFLLTHNVDRFSAPMENHGGPFYYHVFSLMLGFLPWSAFFGAASRDAQRPFRFSLPTALAWTLFLLAFFLLAMPALRELLTRVIPEKPAGVALRIIQLAALFAPLLCYAQWGPCPGSAHAEEKFLACWIYGYFVFFSLSQTKLPNYVLPLYPPMALLIARFLDRWRRGVIEPSGWVMPTVLACWALAGAGTAFALLVAAGSVKLPFLHMHYLPGLERGAWLGMVPVLGAAVAWWCLRRQARDALAASLATTAMLFVGGLVSWGGLALDAHKAPRALVEAAGACQTQREVHVGCYEWYQPSLVFYCRREVSRLMTEEQALELLQCPLPAYLFVPAGVWKKLESKVEGPHRVLARHWDFYRHCEVLVVGNQ